MNEDMNLWNKPPNIFFFRIHVVFRKNILLYILITTNLKRLEVKLVFLINILRINQILRVTYCDVEETVIRGIKF